MIATLKTEAAVFSEKLTSTKPPASRPRISESQFLVTYIDEHPSTSTEFGFSRGKKSHHRNLGSDWKLASDKQDTTSSVMFASVHKPLYRRRESYCGCMCSAAKRSLNISTTVRARVTHTAYRNHQSYLQFQQAADFFKNVNLHL